MTAVHRLASAELKSHRAAHFLSQRDAAIVAKLSVSPPVDHRLKVQLDTCTIVCIASNTYLSRSELPLRASDNLVDMLISIDVKNLSFVHFFEKARKRNRQRPV